MTLFDPNAAAKPGSGIFGLSHTPEEAGVVLVPVPWEATVSFRAGTAAGPAAIRQASMQVDLFDLAVGRPWVPELYEPEACRAYLAGIAMLDAPEEVARWNDEARTAARSVIEAGGAGSNHPAVAQVNALGEKLNAHVQAEVSRWLEAGKLVGVIGGDHSVSLGALRAVLRRHPNAGVLHIDAHADLRPAYEGFTYSHASVMHNALADNPEMTLAQVGLRDVCDAEVQAIEEGAGQITAFYDAELAEGILDGQSWSRQCERVVEVLPRSVYVSLDIDALEPSLCPATGTPVPGGMSWHQIDHLLGTMVRCGRTIVGFDLVEVAGQEWDATVGARLLYRLIGWALKSRRRGGMD